MNSFNEFGLAEPILRSLTEEGYVTPTPIQAQTIPLLLAKRDVIGIAQTGTGKTAAFALPIINHLAANRIRPQPKTCRVLVLSPTRELSGQILDSFRTYGRHVRLSTSLAIGGVNMGPQVRQLAHGVDVLVATPGRLLDLAKSRAIILDKVEVFVLDEADRMLDMGFMPDIKRVLKLLPAKRQNLLFSATFSPDIRKLAEGLLHSPISIDIAPRNAAADTVGQRVVYAEKGDKPGLLAFMISRGNWRQVLVFTRTKHGANRLCERLIKDGLPAAALHGNKSQNARTKALAGFKTGEVRVLVATDIAARGIDIDELPHVINFELPNVPEDYVHRIGRTGRAGQVGEALSLVSREEFPLLRDIERLIRRPIPVFEVEGYALNAAPSAGLDEDRPPRPQGQRRGGGRPGGGSPGGRGPRGRGGRGGGPAPKSHKSAEHQMGKSRKVH